MHLLTPVPSHPLICCNFSLYLMMRMYQSLRLAALYITGTRYTRFFVLRLQDRWPLTLALTRRWGNYTMDPKFGQYAAVLRLRRRIIAKPRA